MALSSVHLTIIATHVDIGEDSAKSAAKSLQSCPSLCEPIDGSPPGSPIPGIFQASVLEWGAIAFSKRKTLGGTI